MGNMSSSSSIKFFSSSRDNFSAPLLSIYIPTHNRFEELNRLVDLLAAEIAENEHLRASVEVVISDNASLVNKDKLLKILEAFTELNVSIYVNENNMGADRNMLCCFERTVGDYVWLLCDDDLIYSGSISDVLSYIEMGSVKYSLFRLGETIEAVDGALIKDLEDMHQNNDFLIDSDWVLNEPTARLLRASCLVLRRQLSFDSQKLVKNYQINRAVSPMVLALDGILEFGPGLGVAGHKVRYVEGDKSSWSYQWPWISSVCVPLLVSDFAKLAGYPEVFIKQKLRVFTSLRCGLAVSMFYSIRSWAFVRNDWEFMLNNYAVLPCFWLGLVKKPFASSFLLVKEWFFSWFNKK